MPSLPSDRALLDAGGWNPRFAQVLAKAIIGDVAIAILDTNGADGGVPYEDTEAYTWDPESGWASAVGHMGAGVGWMIGVTYAADRAPGKQSVLIEFNGERHRVPVQKDGWWLFTIEGDPDDVMPRRVE
jgi:hypothetical protein